MPNRKKRTYKKRIYKKRTYKKRTYKKRAYKKRTYKKKVSKKQYGGNGPLTTRTKINKRTLRDYSIPTGEHPLDTLIGRIAENPVLIVTVNMGWFTDTYGVFIVKDISIGNYEAFALQGIMYTYNDKEDGKGSYNGVKAMKYIRYGGDIQIEYLYDTELVASTSAEEGSPYFILKVHFDELSNVMGNVMGIPLDFDGSRCISESKVSMLNEKWVYWHYYKNYMHRYDEKVVKQELVDIGNDYMDAQLRYFADNCTPEQRQALVDIVGRKPGITLLDSKRRLAVAMTTHDRLGSDSPANVLVPDLQDNVGQMDINLELGMRYVEAWFEAKATEVDEDDKRYPYQERNLYLLKGILQDDIDILTILKEGKILEKYNEVLANPNLTEAQRSKYEEMLANRKMRGRASSPEPEPEPTAPEPTAPAPEQVPEPTAFEPVAPEPEQAPEPTAPEPIATPAPEPDQEQEEEDAAALALNKLLEELPALPGHIPVSVEVPSKKEAKAVPA